MAGYSGTPLAKKLGIKAEGHTVVLAAPEGFDAAPLGRGYRSDLRSRAEIDLALVFCLTLSELDRAFERIQRRLTPNGALWIAWPKKASGVETELSGDIVRSRGLARGLVDNKVCAIDEVWSGLRFVIRIEDREGVKS